MKQPGPPSMRDHDSESRPPFLVRLLDGTAVRFERGRWSRVEDDEATLFADQLKALETARQAGLAWDQFRLDRRGGSLDPET